MNKLCISSPLFGYDIFGGQFTLDALGIHTLFVNLVNRHNNRHISGLGVFDCFFSLRHNTVICSDNQNHNICTFGSTRTHRSKRGVPRRIEKRNHAAVGFHMVGADMLSNTSSLARRYLTLANVIEQRRLTVVHMPHYGNHWRA